MFSTIVKKFRQDNKLSQADFISLISKYNDDFKSLDIVTLSRWERRVTKPHISRQNQLLELIGVNLLDANEGKNFLDEIKSVRKKIESTTYYQNITPKDVNVLRITYTNSHLLKKYAHLVDLVMSVEDNAFFNLYKNQGLDNLGVFEKIINEKLGELNLVLFCGQLIGHSFSINLLAINHELPWRGDFMHGHNHLLISLKSTHHASIMPTFGREFYQYFQNYSKGGHFYVYKQDNLGFDVLYANDFRYQLLDNESEALGKLLKIDHDTITNNKVLMSLLSNYHQGIINA